jgi:hypothetical protein
MCPTTNNKKADGMVVPKAYSQTTDNTFKHNDKPHESITDTMHQAEQGRNEALTKVINATSSEDRTAIINALINGFDENVDKRAEDALADAGYKWPDTASPRSLGAIVAHLSRKGVIVESGWTKGRSGRSHCGRVSLWRISP